MVIEELGPTFVKLGQILSSRSDLVPPDLLAELVKLQDRVPPFPFEQVREIIAEEFGRPLEDIFEAFDVKPLASASLGQVHRARFGGRDVVVKVQRPLIREKIESDVHLMMQLASLLERRVEGWDIHEPTRAVKEFADTISEELDYEVEAAHQERFATQFEDDPTVHVPAVFHDATSARPSSRRRASPRPGTKSRCSVSGASWWHWRCRPGCWCRSCDTARCDRRTFPRHWSCHYSPRPSSHRSSSTSEMEGSRSEDTP